MDNSDDDSDPDDDPTAGAVLLGPVQSEGPEDGDRSKDGAVSLKPGAGLFLTCRRHHDERFHHFCFW